MKSVLVECKNCGKVFKRPLRFYEKNLKNGVDPCCSKSCSAKNQNKSDEYSPFRFYMKRVRSSVHENNIDAQYLSAVWESQKGKCAYTGVSLQLMKKTDKAKQTGLATSASLDRIDSSKGYIKGNVQFISIGMNLAKNNLTDMDAKRFVSEIRKVEGDYTPTTFSRAMESLIPI